MSFVRRSPKTLDRYWLSLHLAAIAPPDSSRVHALGLNLGAGFQAVFKLTVCCSSGTTAQAFAELPVDVVLRGQAQQALGTEDGSSLLQSRPDGELETGTPVHVVFRYRFPITDHGHGDPAHSAVYRCVHNAYEVLDQNFAGNWMSSRARLVFLAASLAVAWAGFQTMGHRPRIY